MEIREIAGILPFLCAVTGGLFVILLDSFAHPETPRKFLGAFSLVFLGAMFMSCFWNMGTGPYPAFSELITVDDFSRFLSAIFAVSAALAALIAMGRLPDEGAAKGEFYSLLLFAAGGASLLTQATDMVSLFIGIECMSIPAYIMAAAMRRNPSSAEAGFKYFVLGAFSSGFLVYGIALLYGAAGGTGFADIASVVASGQWSGQWSGMLLIVGTVFVITGLSFKIAAVPFHMWAPDVYQGSPTPATSFFATAVKAAAFAAMLRLLYMAVPGLKSNLGVLENLGWHDLVWVLAVLTMTIANIVALVQTDAKRILAYSSIAHAGYLLIGLISGTDGAAAIMFYLVIYTFMTAGAFALIAFFEHSGGGTSLKEYAGLGRRYPLAAVALSIFLFSLAGIPPTAGFMGKFYIFKAAIGSDLIVLTVIAVLNSMVSAFYYLKIIVAMYMSEDSAKSAPELSKSMAIGVAVAICLLFVFVLGVYPGLLLDAAKASVLPLF